MRQRLVSKDILVAVFDDDIFSRNWMALLLVRDWRTRLVGEILNLAALEQFLLDEGKRLDFLVVDVDIFGESINLAEITQLMVDANSSAKILLIATQSDIQMIHQMVSESVCGYVLKNQMGFSLGWVISFAFDGFFVMTPGIASLVTKKNIQVPGDKIIIDGRQSHPGFTDHEAEVAKMAFVFSLGRRDLADEMKISQQWSYGLVSELYKKMGLSEIISGEMDIVDFIGKNKIIRKHIEEIIEQSRDSKKLRDLETLAYHLYTMPQIIT